MARGALGRYMLDPWQAPIKGNVDRLIVRRLEAEAGHGVCSRA